MSVCEDVLGNGSRAPHNSVVGTNGASVQHNAPANLPAGRELILPFNCKLCCSMYLYACM